ncbi:MAG: phosphoenolpyruvate synthase [Rhodoferax sp.]|nr:phosphoenolpyruvate synthase [Rhodoferax sp.]HQZ07093.1 phosphoenolpyruvate synthase [Burkholderiaceae bacterium]HRA62016.1 phosphoenolpyruvate synthase [Burkholderiaceae bacterium]
MPANHYIRWFKELSLDDLALVGGKNASLGEMFQQLTPLGVRIPDGFAVTASAYCDALDAANAWPELHRLLDTLDKRDTDALARAGARAREIVYGAAMPAAVEQQLRQAWRELKAATGESLSVAVRSSATAEDLPNASFAGQHDTYLNVQGEEMLIDAVKRCQASLFTDRAISYRIDNGFDHFKVFLSVAVMQMVRSDRASAGVMFTIDTESGHPDVVFITGAWGLGENVVQGAVDPDEFYVHKPTFVNGFRSVLRKTLGDKQVHMVYAPGRTREPVINKPTPRADRKRYCLSDADVLVLADAAIKIEDHYSQRAGQRRAMDIEWAKDGPDGELFIVQARPETAISQRNASKLEEYVLDGTGNVRAQGRAVGAKIATGKVRVVTDGQHLSAFRPGEVLVADTTTPDWEPVMKTAAAIVTNRGGRTCHAAIVARELGIAAVVGAEHASEVLRDGDIVTVSCAEGAAGKVYEGEVKFHKIVTDLSGLKRPATDIMVNLGNPELAFQVSQMPCDGVGLARMEFIINEHIKVHPMAVLHPERIVDVAERERVLALSSAYKDGRSYFVERLAEGVGTIAAAFFPRPVIVRLSDFKSNEYAALLGGRDFEPHEENPMLGFRGAARYIHPAYAEGFALECEAMLRVREVMGLTNLKLMVPFCRRLDEARRVLAAMAGHGLERGRNGLEVYVMCEIPNNVLLIDEFAELFDGFSIGSNDLTQLTLGVDRDSAIVAESFDEQDPGMLKILKMAVEGARRNKRHSGICGQAPSDHIEVARYLVELGIDSISLTPDRVLQTMQVVQEIEVALGRPPRAGD